MRAKSRELWLALLAILLITLLYSGVVYRTGSTPAATGLLGHSLGVLGFLLMLMTEILYPLRKRSRRAKWGRMANWLQFHIFTGLVGPYLVLLHTAWKFNGLAGVVLLLTIIIVASGFIGRYIYTAVPRTVDGSELQARELNERIHLVEEQIGLWIEANPMPENAYAQGLAGFDAGPQPGPGLVMGRIFTDLSYRFNRWRAQRRFTPEVRAKAGQLTRLIQQQRTLRRQVNSLVAARRLLAIWHSIHVPIGVALFTAAFIHIAAAVYYAVLLH